MLCTSEGTMKFSQSYCTVELFLQVGIQKMDVKIAMFVTCAILFAYCLKVFCCMYKLFWGKNLAQLLKCEQNLATLWGCSFEHFLAERQHPFQGWTSVILYFFVCFHQTSPLVGKIPSYYPAFR
ncbi:hypothetical protein AHF37_02868 [Paragonimus kellicotti]|nr:hypothetical protein AHF37_02868 [Paragonimus kellicotti]